MASLQSETMKDYNNKPMSELVKEQAFIITGGMGGGERGGELNIFLYFRFLMIFQDFSTIG